MKKLFAVLLCIAVLASLFSGCTTLESVDQEEEQFKIALIAMDPSLREGAMKAAAEMDANVVSMAAEGADPVQQVGDAVSAGYQALVIAGEHSDEVSAALEEAVAAGVKLVFVDAPEAGAGEVVFATDNETAGREAGEFMIKTLKDRGITSGVVGVIGKNSKADALREKGFRSAFAEEAYTLMDTLTDEDDPEKFAFIAGNYVNCGAVALFCCSESATVGAGQAMKIVRSDAVVMGFGQSEDVKNLVNDRYIHSAVMQNYDIMGYEGVKAAVAMLKGDALTGGFSNTGTTVLEAEVPAMEELLAGDFQDYKIALIAMDRIDWQWTTLEEGAQKASEELGCEIVNLSPGFRDEEEQILRIYNAIDEEADAIIIAAHDSEEVYSALGEAIAAGIQVVCVEEAAGVEAEATYVTDNKAAGKIAGEIMLAELKARDITEGDIGIIGTSAEDETGLQREEGFREAFEGSAYTLLETQYGEADAALSHALAIDFIDQSVAAIFCCSEGAVNGTGNAVEQSGEDVTVVGFGVSERIWEMIEEDLILATVSPDFENMGYEAVRAACAALKGGKLDSEPIDVGAYILRK